MSFFKDDKKIIEKNEDEEVAYLQTEASALDAELICGLLRDAGIPCMAKDRPFGGAVKVVAGLSSFGTDIYVHRPRLEEARNLVNAYFDGQEDPNVPEEDAGGQKTPENGSETARKEPKGETKA